MHFLDYIFKVAVLILAWISLLKAKSMVPFEHKVNTQTVFNGTDNEFDWYKPIAVILKPASSKDLQKRFDVDIEDDHFESMAPRHWPSFDPWTSYETGSEEDNESDQLRQLYDLPNKVEGNLISLARMGLVAIPRKEINHQDSGKVENESKDQGK